MSEMRQCRKCGETKPVDQFPTFDNGTGKKHRHACRKCRQERRTSLYRIDHPQKPPATERRCCRCKKIKPIGEFCFVRRGGTARQARCRSCTQEVCREYRSTAEGKRRKLSGRMLADYGISIDDYEAMLTTQQGRCAICGNIPDRLVVDHDHATGAVRSLLCPACNAGLGMFKDDPARIHAAISYLKKHSCDHDQEG